MPAPLRRLIAGLLVGVLIATACADDTDLDALLESVSEGSTPSSVGGDPATPGRFGVPAAPEPYADPTPLAIDDDYRIGVLDNGLTYLLRTNDTPGASIDLRLVVNAGSLQQPDGLDGSAHFLEHMLFNGTESFPGNELGEQLQSLGIQFGADVNAFTSYDETVYLLGARTYDGSDDVAFDVLAEWAARATIDPVEVAAEIGVVRDELRQSRESLEGMTETAFEEIYTMGTPYEEHLVIGDADLVEATTADTLRAFYDDWYRPDNMAVIAVGDRPLDDLEQEVVSRFATLTSRTDDPPPPTDTTVPLDPEPVVRVLAQPGAADYLSLDIPLPVWDTGTVGGERLGLIEVAVGLMLDRRLDEAFRRGELDLDDPPFIVPFALNRGLRYFGTHLRAPDLDTGLEQYMAQLVSAGTEGFTDDDVSRVRDVVLATLDEQLIALGSVQDASYADELTNHFLVGGPIDDIESRIHRQMALVEDLEPTELTDYWRWILQSSGPVVIAVGDDPNAMPEEERLLAVIESARPATTSSTVPEIDALMDRPPPAAIDERSVRQTAQGEIEEWIFENGLVVSYQYSDITEGSFDIWLASTGGWSALPDPDAGKSQAAVQAVLASGVGGFDEATVARYLESRDISIDAWMSRDAEAFTGHSPTSTAEDLFALLHLRMTDPAVDEIALRTVRRGALSLLQSSLTDPDLRATSAMYDLMTGDGERYDMVLDRAEIDALDADTLLTIFENRFADVDDLHVAIVGDLPSDEAFALTASYLATLPSGAPDSWRDLGAVRPTGPLSTDVVLPDGTADGGLTRTDWLAGDIDRQTEVTAQLLSTIITSRITETIREALGASYGGSAWIGVDREGEPAITSTIRVDGDPARLDEIGSALDAILADLSANGPTGDEFARATRVIEADYDYVDDDLFLAANLARSRFPDQDVLEPQDRRAVLARVTSEHVRDLASSLYADPASAVVRRVLP